MVLNVLLVPAVWLLKSAAFVLIFRVRKIQATYMTCLLIAGVPFLVGLIPLPGILMELCMIGVAVYATMHYTGVSFLPDGLLIPLGVELFFKGGMWLIEGII